MPKNTPTRICKGCNKSFSSKVKTTLFCNRACYLSHQSTTVEEFWNKVDKTPDDGCWNWKDGYWKTSGGYGAITVNGATYRAHRYSWELVNGKIPEGLMVCHRCDNPKCVRPDHLFLGTPKDNAHDMIKKGRHRMGIHKKWSDEQVLEMLRLHLVDGWERKKICKMFNVSPQMLHSFIRGERTCLRPKPH